MKDVQDILGSSQLAKGLLLCLFKNHRKGRSFANWGRRDGGWGIRVSGSFRSPQHFAAESRSSIGRQKRQVVPSSVTMTGMPQVI